MQARPRARRQTAQAEPTLAAPQIGSDHVEDQALQLVIVGEDPFVELISESLFDTASRKQIYIALQQSTSVREAMDMLGAEEADLLVELAASPDDQLDASAIASRLLGKSADRLAGEMEAEARRTGNVRDCLLYTSPSPRDRG